MTPLFHIYRSSAGSGKTRTLAKEFLKLALRFRSDYFKHILAVTFTNKSTQEMKQRIMHYLNAFAIEKEELLAQELMHELQLDAATFQERAREVQSTILHQYQHFSISTIDAFFQRVIRSFTREAGILGDYRLEVEHDEVLDIVISNLISELGANEQLTQWLVELTLQNLENEKAWDMRRELSQFAAQIFREEFKHVQTEVDRVTGEKNFFSNALKSLQKKKFEFIQYTKTRAQTIFDDLQKHHLTAEDFKYKSRGSAFTFAREISKLKAVNGLLGKTKRAEEEFIYAENWIDKKNLQYQSLLPIVQTQWMPRLGEIIDYKSKNFAAALSAEIILNDFYWFGLISDISRKLNEHKRENNIMLLADAAQFLNKIIDQSDTPFIYEKTGAYYRNYLIDEFQDTSGLQWKNLKPLLANSLDSGYPCLIVGDVKQAIYRWRGGNHELLHHNVSKEIGKQAKTYLLNQNFRSDHTIVSFNNHLFETISTKLGIEQGASSLPEYEDVKQTPVKKEEGFVQMKFLAPTETESWEEVALYEMAEQIEQLQQAGVAAHDITLLVRTNNEGEKIISYLLNRKKSEQAKSHCVYDVISSESLRVSNAATVNLIVAAMTYLLNHEDTVARAQLVYEYNRIHKTNKTWSDVFSNCTLPTFENQLPSSFVNQKVFLKKLSLFELTETLIDIFSLKEQTEELPYLLTFQDVVLGFQHRERNELFSFLSWWKGNKQKKYIIAPSHADAMQLFTIHKAKGLQFKYVILPFCSWKMDHEGNKQPLLWEKIDHPAFSNLGYLPIKYSSSLKETFFDRAYDTEYKRIHLDNVNLLYVAFTRAEKGLLIFAPHTDENRNNKKGTVAKWVYEGIRSSTYLASHWNEATSTYQSGKIIVEQPHEVRESTSLLTHYITSPWRTKLQIKQTPSAHPINEEQRSKINYGIHLHAVLANIKYASDTDRVLFAMEADGSINHEERKHLDATFSTWMTDSQIAHWFSNEWNVQTEVVTLLPGGKELRIDRLLLKGKQAIVIDFKTGNASTSDHQQVAEYCAILRDMLFQPQGYLFYLNNGEVQPVTVPKKLKRKNENQLGLDF